MAPNLPTGTNSTKVNAPLNFVYHLKALIALIVVIFGFVTSSLCPVQNSVFQVSPSPGTLSGVVAALE